MSTRILAIFLALAVVAGCSKDKYTTKPQLVYKGVSTREVKSGEGLTFTLEVTDREGDLQDSVWVQRIVRNCSNGSFTQPYEMPPFNASKNFKAQISVCYSLGLGQGCPLLNGSTCPNNDSTTFKFWIRDKDKNVSDTVTSEEIVFVK